MAAQILPRQANPIHVIPNIFSILACSSLASNDTERQNNEVYPQVAIYLHKDASPCDQPLKLMCAKSEPINFSIALLVYQLSQLTITYSDTDMVSLELNSGGTLVFPPS